MGRCHAASKGQVKECGPFQGGEGQGLMFGLKAVLGRERVGERHFRRLLQYSK